MNGKGLWIALGIIVVIALSMGGCYNSMVTNQENIKAQWSQVETVLQRRVDLIPNLVNTVKGYAKHEKELLTDLTKARSQWAAAQNPGEKIKASQNMDGLLSRLMVVVENYPNLKANEGFLQLQDELAGTENRIAVQRMRYNDAVMAYDVSIKRFPANLIAGMFGFKESGEYYKADEKAKEVPKVEF